MPLSGAGYDLIAGEYAASVAGVGASLRVLRHRGRDLVAPWEARGIRPAMSGAVLVPWPNRTADGRYRYAGRSHQLAIDEPATRTATHGLVHWQEFVAVERRPDRLVLAGRVNAQPGYPWRLHVEVSFTLTADGLRQQVSVVNESDEPAPVGIGGHPYLTTGTATRDGCIDEWTLTLPASRVMLISEERMLPTALVAVDGPFDFRGGRRIGPSMLNHAYTDLARDDAGFARARVTDAAGFGTEIAWDSAWAQVYTADWPSALGRRHAVAIEPMSCPPDALNSGTDLRVLAPGATTSVAWIIRATGDERVRPVG